MDLHQDFWFDVLYLLAFLVSFCLLFREGYRKRYNTTAWAVAVAVTWFLFITGTKLFTFSLEEWQQLFLQQHLTPTKDKILFGGLGLVSVGFLVIRRFLHFKAGALDALALALPLSISIQRVGCFLVGCCFGETTTVAWGARYLPGTLPHFHQFEAGYIAAAAPLSLPVHPVQFYEAFACLLVVLILIFSKRFIHAPGNRFVAALVLYSFFRFFVEFTRDVEAYAAGAYLIEGLKVAQWILLGMFCLLAGIFLYREKTYKPVEEQQPVFSLRNSALLTLGLIFLAWGLRDWFTYTELFAVNMALWPACVLVGIALFKSYTLPRYRWLTLSALVLPMLLMSQNIIFKRSYTDDSTTVRKFVTAKAGYGIGNFQNSYTISGSGCGSSRTNVFLQEYTVAGAALSTTTQRHQYELTYGVSAYSGRHQETNLSSQTPESTTRNLWGINPYVRYDRIWLGVGAGMHVGNLSFAYENVRRSSGTLPESGSKHVAVYPQFHARVGPRQLLFTDFLLAEHFPSPFPGYRFQIGVGSGFGLQNGTFLRFGSNGEDYTLGGNLVLGQRLVLEPQFLWKGQENEVNGRQRQASLGLHYRFYYR